MKMLQSKLRQILVLTMLLLVYIFSPLFLTEASADLRYVSRACSVLNGIQESVSYDPSGNYHVMQTNSHHYKYVYDGIDWARLRYINGRWERYDIARTGKVNNWRAVAQHTGEFWQYPYVFGFHYEWVPSESRYVRRARTTANTCGAQNW